ncbi:hypothetical protein BDU57DRAFT_334295 [Ampelomyces quisqualis]|uniref:Uncharacterized protein n=1 Tax=Ampelomyces quisqualis TaxID=50730 RepID=A0A6A5QB80_AMPQU|nr:hypothetical protein BDU57DRAFT_334295 [Ampelomyces quisqualis]
MASPLAYLEDDSKRSRRRDGGFHRASSYDPWADDEVGQRKHRQDVPHNSRRTRESSVYPHDAPEVGRNSHRGRARGRFQRGGARGGRGDSRRETSHDDYQRRHSTAYEEHTSEYVDHYDSRAFARNNIDSYRPSRDVTRESRAEDQHQSGVGQSQQCSPLQSIEDLDRYDHAHQAARGTGARSVDRLEERDISAQAEHYNTASSVHPARSLLMSPANDESRQGDLDNSPSEVKNSQVIMRQAYGRPTPDLTPAKSRSRSPHRVIHAKPTAPRSVNRGLSAEDGHQWARDPETKSRGRSKTRGRGRGRGHGRGSRGQDSRREDGRKECGDGDRAYRAHSLRSPRPHEQSRKKRSGD